MFLYCEVFMNYFKKSFVLLLMSCNCLYANNLKQCYNCEPKIINELISSYNNLSPNIVNLCSDLYSQGYNINKINNSNIGVYLNKQKLIELPIDCSQPDLSNCLDWSGTKYQSQDTIADLYFNMLGFKDRKYNNVFKTNDKYKNIKLYNVKNSYPLFRIEGDNYFAKLVRGSLRNIMYTDPGKMVMYRVFLASAEHQNNPTISFLREKFKNISDKNSELLEYKKFPIIIKNTYKSRSSVNDCMLGISTSFMGLHTECPNENDTIQVRFGDIARPMESSIYHEILHCFRQLYLLQLARLNKMSKLEYKLSYRASVKHIFDLFSEYNKIDEPMDRPTVQYIFRSILLYRGYYDVITSSEEFTAIIGTLPGSKYYYPGAELSENLFRFYTYMPIRDAHMGNIEGFYLQNFPYIQNLKNKMKNLNLKYSKINFHVPMENSSEVKIMSNDEYVNFCKNKAQEVSNGIFYDESKRRIHSVKGYKHCWYLPSDHYLTYGMDKITMALNYFPESKLYLKDVYKIIDYLYPL